MSDYEKLVAELRDVQAKLHKLRLTPRLTDAQREKMYALMEQEDELYDELGPDFPEVT